MSTTRILRTVCPHDCPDACSILVTVTDHKVLRTAGDPDHPVTRGFLCGKVNRYAERVHSPERLLQPLRRIGPKGEGAFAPVSWEAALDEIVQRWQSIRTQYGGEAIAGYAYSAHQGLVNRNFTQALFNALGGTRINAGTVCDTCCGEAWEMTVGGAGGTDPERVQDADLILVWGANIDSTNVHLIPFVNMARQRGAQLVVIDVWRTRTARRADWFLPIRVGTDAALALGMAHVLHRDGLVDHAYIDRLVLGYEQWATEVLPRYTPAVVEGITGIAAQDVEKLARLYGQAQAPFLRLGSGLSRHHGGGMAVRAIACLPGITGAWQRPGGGALLTSADGFNFNFPAIRRPDLHPKTPRVLNMVRFGQALTTWNDPPIQALFVQSNNPAATCPEQGLVRQGLARDDLFTVVHDTFMTDTARYADLLLPACTAFETEDLYRGYGTYYIQYGPQVLAPQGASWSNYHLIRTLAQRFGLQDNVFQRTPREHIAALLAVETGQLGKIDQEALFAGKPQRVNVPVAGHTFDRHFPTPSGKLQIFCPELSQRGLPALPDYLPTASPAASTYPLRLVSAPGHHLHHSAFIGVESLRHDEGGPWARLHPEEARTRAIQDGQPIELFNAAGAVGLYARVTTDAPPGVVIVEGHRPQSHYLSGGPLNILCDARYADFGEGATYQDTWLDIRPLAKPVA